MPSPEQQNTPWEEMGISKKKFAYLVTKDIAIKVKNLLGSGIRTKVHPKGRNTGIAVRKALIAYSIGQIIGHEFHVVPNIEDLTQSFYGVIEIGTDVYENSEEIKENVIEALKERDFYDYLDLIKNGIVEIFSGLWNLPFFKKIGVYLELSVFGNIQSYFRNAIQKKRTGRDINGILKKFEENPELKLRFYRMKKQKKEKK